ncbi:MAG: phosphoribosylamine--glycine ligase [Burkholderiales bacterium]|jgi:phosphoribosylamine--glycine ligase|nr:phosphoribosylamine--glycine ligase [Burkholderiales bacterium]
MNILVIGSGGREHAFAWKIAQSPRVTRVFVAPGNAGTAWETGVINIVLTQIDRLIEFAQRENIAMTLVGPEAPLAAGIVDAFQKAGLRIYGPTQAAAQLESSKDFAKRFMQRHGIPTADAQTFTELAAARAYIEKHGAPVVVKADGLAAGKGVVVAQSEAEALAAVETMLKDNALGKAGSRVLIEEFLEGEEVSFIVMADGEHVLPLATSQDHKRLYDHDEGPNTGGMGAYSPAPIITPQLHAYVMRKIITPTIQGMAEDGIRFSGFLYAGLMIDKNNQPKTLEFNCRMGDPETQPIMMRLKTDFVDLLEHGINGTLDQIESEWDRRYALGVVLAAGGYPQKPHTGVRILGLNQVASQGINVNEDCALKIFHAGTTEENDEIIVSGGRVLCVTALGDSIKIAQKAAYGAAETICFEGRQMRRDIGNRGVSGANKKP